MSWYFVSTQQQGLNLSLDIFPLYYSLFFTILFIYFITIQCYCVRYIALQYSHTITIYCLPITKCECVRYIAKQYSHTFTYCYCVQKKKRYFFASFIITFKFVFYSPVWVCTYNTNPRMYNPSNVVCLHSMNQTL